MKQILALVSLLVALTLSTVTLAGSFTAGNLVIYRIGDGSATLTNRGNVVFLDEYTTNGTLIQSIMMPTNYFGGYSPLIESGTTFGSDLISRSVDGRFILLTGYGATLGQFTNFGLQSATGIEAPRVVGLVDG
jgi:hypothetical protein